MYSSKLALSLFLASSASSSAANLSSGTRRHEKADEKHKNMRYLDSEDGSMAQGIAPSFSYVGQSTAEVAADVKAGVEEYVAKIPLASVASPTSQVGSCTSSHSSGKFAFLDDSCAPRGKQCDGGHFYKILNGVDIGVDPFQNGVIPYSTFLEKTPEGCVLAPIHSNAEYAEVVEAVGNLLEFRTNVWVGLEKNPIDVLADNNSSGSTGNWYNLDGTPAAVCDIDMWFLGSGLDEPQNGSAYANLGPETRAFLFFGLPSTRVRPIGQSGISGFLADNINSPFFGPLDHALYKCCSETQQFNSCNL